LVQQVSVRGVLGNQHTYRDQFNPQVAQINADFHHLASDGYVTKKCVAYPASVIV